MIQHRRGRAWQYLRGLWHFDRESSFIRDWSGHQNHLYTNNFDGNELTVSDFGPCLELQSDDHYTLHSSSDPTRLGQRQWTLIMLMSPDNALAGSTSDSGAGGVTGYPIICKGEGEADGDNRDCNWFFGWTSSYFLVADFEDLASGGNHPITSGTAMSQDNWFTVACTYDQQKFALWQRDEATSKLLVEVASTATTATPRYDSIQKFSIAATYDSLGGVAGNIKSRIKYAALFTRSIEHMGLKHFDWNEYFETQYTLWVPTAAGGTNITPPQGDLALSTTAAELDFGFFVPGQNLLFSTVAPDLDYGINIPQSNLTLSATAPTVEAPTNISVPQGDLALDSIAPSLDFNIVVGQTNLTLSATAPTVGIDLPISPGQGNLTLSTTAGSLDLGIYIPQTNLVLSATAPTVDVPSDVNISPGQGNLTLEAFAPIVNGQTEIIPDQGDLAFSTFSPSLDFDFPIPQANLALSQSSPILDSGAHPPSIDLAFSTTAPSVDIKVRQVPNAYQLALSTTAPSIGTGRVPGHANISLNGFPPSINLGASWAAVSPDSESWTPVGADTETWTPVTPDTETWN